MLNNTYYDKYLMYKIKYNTLKIKLNNQYGGTNKYSENQFSNFSKDKYPPCYEICGATKKVFDILENKNLLEKYHQLIDHYSIVLCQEVYLKQKKCSETMFDQRYELISKNHIPENIKDIVNENIIDEPQNKIMIEFLENITFNIENNIEQIKNDSDLNKKEKQTIIKMNSVFYQVHYNELTKNC